ncbi:MAG: acyl-CoA thioesterase [Gammaproteobacteria bacterium]|jgi:acyl-CoA hydrolase|nr:acyl-CoA thioesterase [Gammaproteobacteria bacterium]
MSEFTDRVEASLTRITKLVFPQDTNHIHTLYGGTALQWMDEVGFLVATRFSRQKVVTVSMDRVDFKVPIPEGSIIELVGKVTRVGTSSMTIRIQLFREDMFLGGQELAVSAEMVFVAIGDDNKPTPLSVHDN